MNRYNYWLRLKGMYTTVTAFHFTDRETALYDAIERAFRILEQRELRRLAQGGQPNAGERRSPPPPRLPHRRLQDYQHLQPLRMVGFESPTIV